MFDHGTVLTWIASTYISLEKNMKTLTRHSCWYFIRLTAIACSLALAAAANADEPGRGRTAAFETDFLKMMIDHHYSALRITELAAGTDVHRNAQTLPGEGTSPTPGMPATLAKSGLNEIKSLARRNNRMQREEILMAQDFLRKWYGIAYSPKLDMEGRQMIRMLEHAQPGQQFDRTFLEAFSRHHYMALTPATTCVVASEIRHEALHRYCRGIVQAQLNDIEDMRELLAKYFNIVDYRPDAGSDSAHVGSEGEASQQGF